MPAESSVPASSGVTRGVQPRLRRGFEDLLEAEDSSGIGATHHQRRPDQRSTRHNGYGKDLVTAQVGDLNLAIPKLRQGNGVPNRSEPCRRVDKTLDAAVLEVYSGGLSTRKVVSLEEA